MEVKELNTYIDKVLGNSLRCLLPSYWWRRLLKLVVEYIDGVDSKVKSLDDKINNLDIDVDLSDYATKTEVDEVKSEVTTLNERVDILDGMVTSLDGKVTSLEKFAKSRSWISITIGDVGYAVIIADGEETRIAPNSTEDIHFIDTFNISEGRTKIIEVNAPYAFTSRVASMALMFYNCEQITSLDLSSFDTSNVKTMNGMFHNCKNLTSLNISSFNTSKVEVMLSMFFNCKGLVFLDLGHFDTSNVRDMGEMFYGCSGLTSLDLSSFDTSKVMRMTYMFYGCNELTSLTLGEGFFKTQSVTEVDFSDLGNWSQYSFIQSVVTNSYDRATNGLSTLEIKLHPNVYAYLTDEHKATLTSKGYVITPVSKDPDNIE